MDFAPDATTTEHAARLEEFMAERVYPAEPVVEEQVETARRAGTLAPPRRGRGAARPRRARRGLWNLFLPGEHGAGLTNLQYAPLAEITGRCPHLAPEALNCAAPDTGNMEVLAEFGTAEQQERWLAPLLDGTIRSAFCMTEPEVASSDATNIATRIRPRRRRVRHHRPQVVVHRRDGPRCRDLHRDGTFGRPGRRLRPAARAAVDGAGAARHPGVTVRARADASSATTTPRTAGTPRSRSTDVRVPASNILLGEGKGFAIAQARLGPGRIHHCMRLIGMARARARADVPPRPRPGGVRAAAGRAGRGARAGRRTPGWRWSRRGCWCSRPPG